MTEYAIIYIVRQILTEIVEFFTHWYVGGYRKISRALIRLLEELDRTIAFRITLRYFGKPLFQDRSIVGYIIGFFFRSFRLLLGGILYVVVIIIAFCLLIIWAGIPVFIIFKIFT